MLRVQAQSLSLVSAVVSEESPTELEHWPMLLSVVSTTGQRSGVPVIARTVIANLKKPSGPGRGLDGWGKPILAALPDQSLIILAKLFSAVEREDQFPSRGGGTIVV